jgi:hypothetical protein
MSVEQYLSLGHITARFAIARASTVDEWFVTQPCKWHRHFNNDPGALWLRGERQEIARDMEPAPRQGA